MQSLDIPGIDFDLIVAPVHILAWGPGRWHVHSEPSGGVDEGEDIGSSDRAFVVSLSSFVRIAALHHTNCPGSFSERQMNQDSLMKALLGDKNMQEKTRSWRVPGAEPCVLTCLFLLMFPKLHFCMLFEKNLQPGRHFTGPRRDQIEPERPQKHKVLSQKPVFTMSGRSSKIGVSRCQNIHNKLCTCILGFCPPSHCRSQRSRAFFPILPVG